MMQFEYVVVYTGGMPQEKAFNEMGGDGWELISVAFDYAYFKRVKTEKKATATAGGPVITAPSPKKSKK